MEDEALLAVTPTDQLAHAAFLVRDPPFVELRIGWDHGDGLPVINVEGMDVSVDRGRGATQSVQAVRAPGPSLARVHDLVRCHIPRILGTAVVEVELDQSAEGGEVTVGMILGIAGPDHRKPCKHICAFCE